MLVATPTASGKTLIAIMAALNHLSKQGKCLYLTPLRALASEKLEEFRMFIGEDSSYRVTASTGDYDSSDPWLANYDVIVATNEKADSLLRHKAQWINQVTLIVADEVHLLGEPDRGPTLEMTLTRLREAVPSAQLLALSATVRNADEIADWLGSESVTMDWRPVPLREGVFCSGVVEFTDGRPMVIEQLDYDPAIAVALQTVRDGGQSLIFATTRRKAEAYAEKASEALMRVPGILTDQDLASLRQASEDLRDEGERSGFTERLARLMQHGAAFHHAGLGYMHRRTIETAYRGRHLKILAATPTLAAGVNLPARTVIIPELWRYDVSVGRNQVSVTEYKQYCGRAGRPGFDEVGYAVPISRNEDEKELIMEKYVKGMPERIWSRLGSERHLRTHVLALIATGGVSDGEALRRFFEKTLFAHQYGAFGAKERLEKAVEFLAEQRFIEERGGKLLATRIGKRVSELYIDPLAAVRIIEQTKQMPSSVTDETLLQIVCGSHEVPRVRLRINNRAVHLFAEEYEHSLIKIPGQLDDAEGFEEYLEVLKLVIVMKAWIEEESEASLYERFRLEPGDLAVLRDKGGWISYAASELTKLLGHHSISRMLELMTERIKNGVKPELVVLTRLQGVGRVRARQLFDHKYTSLEDLRRASLSDLERVPLIGPKVAHQIKSQLG